MKLKWLAIFSIVMANIFLPVTTCGQSTYVNYRFHWLNTSSGLSQNTVNSVFRDKSGYVWIGTNHGLNRFSGEHIRTFSRASAGAFSLGNDIVRHVVQLENGNIAAGTLDGITIFDKSADTNHVIHPESFTGNIADKIVTGLFEGYSGQLFVGTTGGILLYDIASAEFLKQWPKSEFSNQPEHYSFNTWNFIKASGRLLAFIGRNVYRYDAQSFRFIQIRESENSEVVFSGVQQVPGSEELLCYGKGVLCFYSPATNSFHNDMTAAVTSEGKPLVIESAVAVTASRIFAGVNKGGLFELNLEQGTINSMSVLMDNATAFSGQNRFGSMMVDIQGNLWVGTDYGVFYGAPNVYNVRHYVRNDLAGFGLADNSLRSILEMNGGRVLLGGSKGLSLFDRKKSSITTLKLPWQNAGRKEQSYSVNAIEEHKGEIWIAGHMGLARIDERLSGMTVIAPGSEPGRPGLARVWGLCIVGDTIWMCTLNGALFSYTIADNRLRVYKPAEGQTFFQVKKYGNRLIIAAFGGVYCFNTPDHEFSFIRLPHRAGNVQVNTIMQADAGKWLVGTEGEGVFSLDPEKRSFENGEPMLRGKVVYSLCKDRQQNIWAGCNDGLYRISGGGVNRFTIQDGLQENEFTYGKSAQLLQDGRILIGGVNGFNLFAPEKLVQQSSPFPVYLEQYRVNSRTWFHPLNEIKKVEVNYNDKLIQFHFTFPDPGARGTIHYFAQVQGNDTTWRNLGGSGDWIFSDFSPGNYQIKVRACLAETGIPVSRDSEFTFVVRPAYYQTFAFRLMLSLLALGILIFTFFYFYQRQRAANKLLRAKLSLAETEQHLAEANMAALRAQMNPHFIFNALGSIQNLIFKNEKDASISYLQRFAKMVRYILDKSRHEMVEVEEEIKFLNSYLEMQQLRHQYMTMSIRNSLPPEYMHLRIPSMVIQPLLENSIEHAFPDKKATMVLSVAFMIEGDLLKIVIADNGIGINAAPGKVRRDAHESFGVEAVKNRLANLSKKYKKEARMLITDLAVRNETGTEVILLLPIIKTETAYD